MFVVCVLLLRLYVSPKCPPTPKQLQVTPVKWFSEGHHHRGNGKPMDVPSLDDVRKSLTFHINEMENTALQPKTASPLSAARHRSKEISTQANLHTNGIKTGLVWCFVCEH